MKCMKEVQHEDLNVTEVINEFVKELNGNGMYNQQILTSCPRIESDKDVDGDNFGNNFKCHVQLHLLDLLLT